MLKMKITNKSFDDKIIFKNTELSINDNDFLGIKGKSGAGKTTLLSMIGLLQEFDGEYIIDDKLLNNRNKNKLRKEYFSYVFQKSFLIPYFTVLENIIMPLKNANETVDKSRIYSMAKELEIDQILDCYPKTLSGGEAQRVAILRAYFSKRKYMLVDEPTGSLDPENPKKVMELFKKLNTEYGITIIMVTHSNDFDSYFNRLLYLDNMEIKEYA